MTTMTRVASLPVDFIMETWRPGSRGDDWSWNDEMSELRERGELHSLAADILQSGGVREPVLLGGDGRVWDGHHRIICAFMKGVREIPVTFAFI